MLAEDGRAPHARLADHPEIASVLAVSGPNNLLAIVICRDVEHLYRYLAENLASVDHIQSYEVSIRAKRLKQAASLIRHGQLVHAGHLEVCARGGTRTPMPEDTGT